MEKFFTKTSVLIYIIVALLVFNVATIIFFLSEKKELGNSRDHREIHKGDFIKEKLNLSDEQQKVYNTFNDSFRIKGKAIMDSMQVLRMQMLKKITVENPDSIEIEALNQKFGALHIQLKRNTIDFYFRMREICTPSQQDSLKNIFTRMLQFEGGKKPFKKNHRDQHEPKKFN